MIALLAMLALAAPPSGAPGSFELASGRVEGLITSSDGRLVGAVANSVFHLLDTETWQVQTSTPCGVTSASFEAFGSGVDYVWVGCGDGDVRLLRWEDGALSTVAVDGDPVVYDLTGRTVLGLWAWEEGETVYALSEVQTEGVQMHAIDIASGTVDGGGFPILLARSGFVDGVRTASRIVIFQGGSSVAQLTLGSASLLPNLTNYPFDIEAAAPSVRDSVYTIGGSAVTEYVPPSFLYTAMLTDLSGGEAITASTVEGDEWLLVADASGVRAYELNQGSLVGATPMHTFDPGVGLADLAVARWGYAVAGTTNGRMLVLTDNPWVSDVTISPEVAEEGDTVTLSFTVDRDVDYEVFVGGDATGSGRSVATGEVAADEDRAVELEVGEGFTDGATPVFVLVNDGAGAIGHGAAEIVVDVPPGAPSLSVTAGNNALTARIGALPDADLSYYTIYVTTTPFEAEDWPTGGPPFDGDDALDAPIQVPAVPDEVVTWRIAPLTNDTRYTIAVRATDAGGKEGSMSAVVQGTPSPTTSASGIAGDPGGGPRCACATGGTSGWGALGALAAFGLLRRRRGALLAGLLVVGAAAPVVASAGERGDTTPAWANFEFRYGGLRYVEPSAVVDNYGKTGHGFFQAEVGLQAFRFFEMDVGAGYYRDSTFVRDPETGLEGDEGSALVLFPLLWDVTLRAHIWDEQVFVPYGRIGLDYVIWRERTEDGSGLSDIRSGAKAGWHFGFGGQILLDTFAPRRASQLEASTGINDTWLTVEWRRQRIEPGRFLFLENSEGLSFSGDWVTVGLKLDW